MTTETQLNFADQYRSELHATIDMIDTAKVQQAIAWMNEARLAERHIFICGNGGSAATSSHFVVDMIKGASGKVDPRFRIMALTDQIPTMTAYANDVHYESIFLEPLRNFAKPGDVVIGVSGSGNSPNVWKAVDYANGAGCKTIALTGCDGGKLASLGQLNIHINSSHMGRIEDAHMIICHMICYSFMDNIKR